MLLHNSVSNHFIYIYIIIYQARYHANQQGSRLDTLTSLLITTDSGLGVLCTMAVEMFGI
jgi:division protein CdvB (Snf7/Vps24/ESCRT-III family)